MVMNADKLQIEVTHAEAAQIAAWQKGCTMPPGAYAETPSQQCQRENAFVYHAPHGNQAERYTAIRTVAGKFAELLNTLCPGSRELSLAMTNLEQSVFWANAAIARNEHP
jgi:hypothetical protein